MAYADLACKTTHRWPWPTLEARLVQPVYLLPLPIMASVFSGQHSYALAPSLMTSCPHPRFAVITLHMCHLPGQEGVSKTCRTYMQDSLLRPPHCITIAASRIEAETIAESDVARAMAQHLSSIRAPDASSSTGISSREI